MNAVRAMFEAGFLQVPWVERIGWTLLHSLWQIAVIALLYAMVSALLRKQAAKARYLLGCAAMLAMVCFPVGTYLLLPGGGGAGETLAAVDSPPVVAGLAEEPATGFPPPDVAPPLLGASGAPPSGVPAPDVVSEPVPAAEAAPSAIDFSATLRPWMPWATTAWLLGVCLLSLRPIGGWLHIRRLQRHGLSPLTDPLRQAAGRLARRLGVTQTVQFVQSTLVEVPTVVGCLRPFVLLPASAVSGLSVAEIELILTHELAHIRRHDYLANLAQTLIESLLFFHPAMWWVSRQVRRERENCCDDIVVAVSGNRAHYVQALTRLEEQRLATPAAVLAATGGSLLDRVRRLLGQPSAGFGYRSTTAWLAGLLTIGIVSLALAIGDAPQGDPGGNEVAAKQSDDATPESDREAMLAYARALAAGDLGTLEKIWQFKDDIDRQFARNLAGMFAGAEDMSVELVSMELLNEKTLFACFLLRDGPEGFGPAPTPQFVFFHRQEGRWRCPPLANLRQIVNAREMAPDRLGRRAITQKMIALRFGPPQVMDQTAGMKAQRDACALLARPPYKLAKFGKFAEQMKTAIEKMESTPLRSWEDLWRLALDEREDMFPRPGDFYLSFYLEAGKNDPNARKLPFVGDAEPFPLEPFPSLTEDSVLKAGVVESPRKDSSRIDVALTPGGAKIFGELTRQSVGKRLAIVVDGKVVSAPVIRAPIPGGKALIEGNFSRQEAEAIAEKLNFYRKAAGESLKGLDNEEDAGNPGSASGKASPADKVPDNPLGLDDPTLIRLFNTGRTLRAAARECVAYHVKYGKIPESAESLFEDYQQFRQGMIDDPFAAKGGVLRITQRMDGPDNHWLQVWSVGPDGDWDGGKVIDASDPSLDGDLGAEMRMGKWKFNWLADETMAMHLDGKRLSHYLAALGPRHPGAINPHQTLAWGPVVDGLCMAVKFVPDKETYSLGEKIGLEFHVRNISQHPITIAGFSWRQDAGPDCFVIENDQGEKLDVSHAWYSGRTPIQRNTLKPGKVAVFKSSALAFLVQGMPRPEHPVGHTVVTRPGRHTLQFKLIFPDGESSGPDGMPRPTDWQGALQTATEVIAVVAPTDNQANEGSDNAVGEKTAAAEAEALAEDARQPTRSTNINEGSRERFLAIERFARLPMAEQAKQLPQFYKDMDPRSINPIVEGILSSAPHHILDRYQKDDAYDGNTDRWAEQLADAASAMSIEEVADKLERPLFLNVAARARALRIFEKHAVATEALIAADLESRDKAAVERAAMAIISLDLRTFTDKLLALWMADDELSESVWGALVMLPDPAIVDPLLERVEKDPGFLARCSGLFLGPLAGKKAEPRLLKFLDSPDAEIRYHAAYALQECRDPGLAQPTVRLAGEKEARFRFLAAHWASKLPEESFQSIRTDLLPLLSDKDDEVRFYALRSFGGRKDLAAGPVILEALRRDQLAENYKTWVMQAMSKLMGDIGHYDMHHWGPGTPENRRAIEQFEAWLEEQQLGLSEEASVEKAGIKFEAGFIPEKTEIMAGEAIFVTFYVRNTGEKSLYLETGGDGRATRSYRFQFSAVDADGNPARDPQPNPGHFGGIQGPPPEIKPGETYSERLQLAKWLAFDRPGDYTVRCTRTLQFPGKQDFTRDYALVHPLATSFRLMVVPRTEQGLAARIEALGKQLRAEEDENNARLTARLLAETGDPRIIPDLLWAAEKWAGDSWALHLLAAFKDDPRVITLYREALRESRGNSRRSNAARLMGESENKGFLPDLLRAFGDEDDKFVLTSVATALGQFGDRQAVPVLKKHRDHDYPHLRLQVEQSLVQCGEALDVLRFQAMIRSTDPTWHSAAHFVSVNAGAAAPRILAECLDFDHPEADVSPNNADSNPAYRNGLLLMYIAQAGGPQFDYKQIHKRPATAGETEANRQTLRKVKEWLEKQQASIGGKTENTGGEGAETALLPKAENLPGKLVFHGRYRHRSHGRLIESPSELWLKQDENGQLHALAHLPWMGSYDLATGDANHRVESYLTIGKPKRGRPAYRIQLHLRKGKAMLTRKGIRQDLDNKGIPVPSGAHFDPNSRPDSYCAANIFLRGLGLAPGQTKEFAMFDWDNTGESLVDYSVRIRHAGKERVTVPAGTFEANHFVLEQLTTADTWFKKRAKHITDFWVLENGVVVRIMRHREPYEMELLDYTLPKILDGRAEELPDR